MILFAHSYSGVVGSEAVRNLGKASRGKEGKPGGVVHLIYCYALVLPEGARLMMSLNDIDLPWFNTEDKIVVRALTAEEIFYNDLDEATQENGPHVYSPSATSAFTAT